MTAVIDNHPVAIAVGIIGMILIGAIIAHEYIINIHGVVNVPRGYEKPFTLTLNISKPAGSKLFPNAATIRVGRGFCLRIVTKDFKYSGNLRLVLNGIAILRNVKGRTYTINLPCLVALNDLCYRVQMLIPGYDTPIPVEPGDYTVSLQISWKASGKGEFDLKLAVVLEPCRTFTVQK